VKLDSIYKLCFDGSPSTYALTTKDKPLNWRELEGGQLNI